MTSRVSGTADKIDAGTAEAGPFGRTALSMLRTRP